jgi:hypothetical protein
MYEKVPMGSEWHTHHQVKPIPDAAGATELRHCTKQTAQACGVGGAESGADKASYVAQAV